MNEISNKSLNLTTSALSRIQSVMIANDDLGSKFRVYVTGGGCSGFQYGFKFDLLDSMSYPYLYGSTLDFVEDLSGSKFVINNPNAKTTCGCGESFTI